MWRISIFVFTFAFTSALQAQGQNDQGRSFGTLVQDRDKPVTFNSETMFVDEERGYAEMEGDVEIIQGQTTLTAHYAEAYFDSETNDLDRFYAKGSVVLISGDDIAKGDEAIYNFSEKELIIDGNAYVFQNGNTVNAKRAVISTDSGAAVMTGRVSTTLIPKKIQDKAQ